MSRKTRKMRSPDSLTADQSARTSSAAGGAAADEGTWYDEDDPNVSWDEDDDWPASFGAARLGIP